MVKLDIPTAARKLILRIFFCSLLCMLSFCAQGGVTVTTLFSFSGTNGCDPEGGLIEGPDGSFYGTTRDTTAPGGNYGFGRYGIGTIYKIATNGTVTTLFRFSGTNGAYPRTGLTFGRDGNFYGTTVGGGSNNDIHQQFGTIFKISLNGDFISLASFKNSDEANRVTSLLKLKRGDLFGTTIGGEDHKKGAPPSAHPGDNLFDFDTVFKLTTNGVLTVLAQFEGTNGSNPYTGLIQGPKGYLYGTTAGGGTNGGGTVFRISPVGELTTLVHFGGTNGSDPNQLTIDKDGNLYGTTSTGGLSYTGTAFKINPKGKLKILAYFNKIDGGYPNSALVAGSDCNFYGTTASGGSKDGGTIFRLTPSGKLTIEYSFSHDSVFAGNRTTLTRASDGNLYGTTTGQGQYHCGSIFRVTLDSKAPNGKQVSQPAGPRPTNEMVSIGTVSNLEVWFRPTLPPHVETAARLLLYRFRTSGGDFFIKSSVAPSYKETPEAAAKTTAEVVARARSLQAAAGTEPLLVLDTYEEDFPDGSIELLEGHAIFYPDGRNRMPTNDPRFTWEKYPGICWGYGFLTNFDFTPDDHLVATIPLNWKGIRKSSFRILSGHHGGP